MCERGWNCMDTSTLIFKASENSFGTIKDWGPLTIVSAEDVRTGLITDGSMMDQR